MALGDIGYLRLTRGQVYSSQVFTWLADPARRAAIGNTASLLGIDSRS